MQTGITIDALANEVARQAELKDDLVFDTRQVTMLNGSEVHIPVTNGATDYEVSHVAHRQIAANLKIPVKFYDRLRAEVPTLLDENVNRLFRYDDGEKRTFRHLLRTFGADGDKAPILRAFLSDRYRMRDNDELLAHILPMLKGLGKGKVISSAITDTRLYIRFVSEKLQTPVEVGDIVQGGVSIRNSEVGHSSLAIQPFVYRLVCKNGMVAPIGIGEARRYTHLGAELIEDEDARVFSDETLRKDDEAFFAKVGDAVKASVDEANFEMLVSQMRDAREGKKLGKPLESMERITKKFDLTDTEFERALNHLIEGADTSAYGVMNALTATAREVGSYDRGTELEEAGGRVLQMAGTREWEAICS